MKIAILTDGIAPEKIGGSETQTLALAGELGKRHDVRVLVRRMRGLPRRGNAGGFSIVRFGRTRRFGPPLFSFTLAVIREIRKIRKGLDCLLAKNTTNGLIAVAAGKAAGVPVAVLIEGEQEYRSRRLGTRMKLRVVSRNARLLVQTPRIRDEVLARTGVAAALVPNGVRLPAGHASGEKILYVGRLVRDKINDKGVRFLIEAVRGSDLETVIVGDGPEMERLRALALGSANIAFAGQVPPDAVAEYMRRAFVLVVPSIYGEGLPNVILEAFALGLPVIATDTAGISDVIETGRTGYLIPPGRPEEIRRPIEILRADRTLHSRMSENCRRIAAGYGWESAAARFEEVLEATARSGRRASRSA